MYKIREMFPWHSIYNDAGEYLVSLNDREKAEIICELLNQDQIIHLKNVKSELVDKTDYVGVS